MSRCKDITGTRSGKLVAIRDTGQLNSNNSRLWECRCDCGNVVIAGTSVITQGRKTHCGCSTEYMDITGMRKGKLVAVKYTGRTVPIYGRIWLFRCDCGNTKELPVYRFKRLAVGSCGCAFVRHGKDITGLRSGKLVALRDVGKTSGNNRVWECSCDCGGSTTAPAYLLINGRKHHCGCVPARAVRGRSGVSGVTISDSGYRMLHKPAHHNANGRGYVAEHRYVIAAHLGRPLTRNEVVHHKDGNRLNNDISNLQVCIRGGGSHPPGQAVDDILAWCREFLQKYDKPVRRKKGNDERT